MRPYGLYRSLLKPTLMPISIGGILLPTLSTPTVRRAFHGAYQLACTLWGNHDGVFSSYSWAFSFCMSVKRMIQANETSHTLLLVSRTVTHLISPISLLSCVIE